MLIVQKGFQNPFSQTKSNISRSWNSCVMIPKFFFCSLDSKQSNRALLSTSFSCPWMFHHLSFHCTGVGILTFSQMLYFPFRFHHSSKMPDKHKRLTARVDPQKVLVCLTCSCALRGRRLSSFTRASTQTAVNPRTSDLWWSFIKKYSPVLHTRLLHSFYGSAVIVHWRSSYITMTIHLSPWQ